MNTSPAVRRFRARTGSKIIACLSVMALSSSLFAAKKKYDERGNVVAGEEKETTAAEAAQKTPTPAVTPEKDGAAEEASFLANQKNPPTQVYWENAQLYLRSGKPDKALEFLKKSAEAGEDDFSREAKLQSLWLRSRRGEANLESEADGFEEKIRLAALLRIADGYAACALEQPKKKECPADAERIYGYLSDLAPRSPQGRLARVRLGLTLLDAGQAEAALPHLVQTLLTETVDPKSGSSLREMPLDRAWFALGQLYERPWYHRDAHKAALSYRQVLKYDKSPYRQKARDRLAYLEKYAIGYARP